MALSEKKSWRRVLELAETLPRGARRDELMELAADMLDQVATGVHTNPRKQNPSLVIWGNPGGTVVAQMDQLLSDRAYELAYRHVEDGQDYKHDFASGVTLYTVLLGDRATTRHQTRGALLFRPDGKPLWDDF